MKTYHYILSLLAVIIIGSCSKDIGNYEYKPINELNIVGVNNTYTMRTGIDTLRIKPNITATMDESDTSRYRYLWILQLPGTLNFDTIGRKRNLEYPVRLSPLVHDLYYRVLDKNTGVTWIANTKITVTTAYSRGILVMGEDEQGFAEAEMLSMIKDTIVIRNILSKSGLPKLKDPISFFHTGSSSDAYIKLWAFTKSGSYYLDRASLVGNPSNNFSKMLYISESIPSENLQPVAYAPQVRTVAGVNGSGLYRAFITKGGDIFAGAPLLSGGDYYNNPINRVASAQTTRIPAAPYLIYPINAMNSIMWYDTVNQRFLNFASIAIGVASTVLTDLPTDPFPWNQPAGRTLVYAENTKNTNGGASGTSFAVMKNADNTNLIYKLYASTVPVKVGSYAVKPIATDFNKASFYAFSSTRSVVLYAVGNKLYAYDYNPGFEKIYQFPELSTDEITMVKFDTQIDATSNSVYIGTYNATTKGTLRRFLLGTNPNLVELLPQDKSTWSGMVKIKDINWRAIN